MYTSWTSFPTASVCDPPPEYSKLYTRMEKLAGKITRYILLYQTMKRPEGLEKTYVQDKRI